VRKVLQDQRRRIIGKEMKCVENRAPLFRLSFLLSVCVKKCVYIWKLYTNFGFNINHFDLTSLLLTLYIYIQIALKSK